MPLRRPSVTLLFLQEKVGYQIAPSSDPASPAHLWFMVASPGPDRTVPRTVRPPRGRLWGWEIPCRVSSPLPSNGLAREGTPSRSGRQPAKTRRAPPAFPSNAPRPVGQASQSFPARRRGKKMRSCFDRLCRPKHTSQPPVCPQGARSGCIPQFWEGPHTKQTI